MLLKFLIGPVIMLLASLAIGMHGTLLHIAVVQVSHKKKTNTYRNCTPSFFPLFIFVQTNKKIHNLKHGTSSASEEQEQISIVSHHNRKNL